MGAMEDMDRKFMDGVADMDWDGLADMDGCSRYGGRVGNMAYFFGMGERFRNGGRVIYPLPKM